MSQQSLTRSRIDHRHHRRLQVEALEDRRLLALVTVNTELDLVNPGDEFTSLREAISETNALPGPDDIVFDFGHDGPATILLEQGELEIMEALTVTGDGRELLAIDAQEQSRIFNITAETGDFTIAGMTLTRGRTTGDSPPFSRENTFHGGAIRSLTSGGLSIRNSEISNNSTTGTWAYGGGVSAEANVTVTSSTISNNANLGEGGSGGGVYCSGEATLIDSTISGNSVPSDIGWGGGIRGYHVTVTGSTISGNSSAWLGGGIHGNELAITDSRVSDNSAVSGGGISGSRVTLTNSTVNGNTASHEVGGILTEDLTVINSTISENVAGPDGSGGIEIRGDGALHVTITGSTISGNSGGEFDRAGGIGVFPYEGYATVMIRDSTISGNSGHGGGIRGRGNSGMPTEITLVNTTVSGNTANVNGGGIIVHGVDLTLANSTVSGNSAGRYGGGIFCSGDSLTVTGTTISDNSAGLTGGGIWNDSAPITVKNAILAGNTDDGTAPDLLASTDTVSVAYSLIGDNTGTILAGAPVGSPDADGNLIGGPIGGVINPLLGPLADNGGPTWTHALLFGSPAVDAGDPSAMPGVDEVPLFDQRGDPFSRVYDGDGVDGPRIDMGAFELQQLELLPGDLNGDHLINFGDLTPFAIALTDPEAYEAMYPDLDRVFLCDINGDGECNMGDLAPFVSLLTGGQAAANVSLGDGESMQFAWDLPTVPGNLGAAMSQTSLREGVAQRDTSGVATTAGLRDMALIAWLSTLPVDDADSNTESAPRISEADDAVDLATGVVESVFHGIGT